MSQWLNLNKVYLNVKKINGFSYATKENNRPLSRRLDRYDRMIQNEGDDSRKLFTLKIALCR